MKIKYLDKRFRNSSLETIAQANKIIGKLKGDGYSITLRQLYYQFVAKDLIANNLQEYKKLGVLMADARLAGLVDWYALTDRTRNLLSYPSSFSVAGYMEEVAAQYHVNPWDDQENYVEVWIEKEALIDVVSKACGKWRVPHYACKGYNSVSEQWEAGRRFARKMSEGKHVHLLHLGDHDPSGIHMTQDNRDRLKVFVDVEANGSKGTFQLHRLALNMPQVEHYKPPHNPAKPTDSRFASYRKKFGKKCWELDALSPDVINMIVERRVKTFVDEREWNRSLKKEREGQREIQKIASTYNE